MKCIHIPNEIVRHKELGMSEIAERNKEPQYAIHSIQLNILVVASFTKEKRLDTLLRVAYIMMEKGYCFSIQIAGTGILKDTIESAIKLYGLNKYINVLGYVEEMSSLYVQNDIVLSTSELEGLPLNILEAKLYGNYVCAVDCDTGPRELINPSLDYDSVIMQPHTSAFGAIFKKHEKKFRLSLDFEELDYQIASFLMAFDYVQFRKHRSFRIFDFKQERKGLILSTRFFSNAFLHSM